MFLFKAKSCGKYHSCRELDDGVWLPCMFFSNGYHVDVPIEYKNTAWVSYEQVELNSKFRYIQKGLSDQAYIINIPKARKLLYIEVGMGGMLGSYEDFNFDPKKSSYLSYQRIRKFRYKQV